MQKYIITLFLIGCVQLTAHNVTQEKDVLEIKKQCAQEKYVELLQSKEAYERMAYYAGLTSLVGLILCFTPRSDVGNVLFTGGLIGMVCFGGKAVYDATKFKEYEELLGLEAGNSQKLKS